MIKIHGGTHLGIVGLYGERDFDVESIEEVEKIIREEEGLQKAGKSSYTTKVGTKVHTLTGRGGITLFEFTKVEEEA